MATIIEKTDLPTAIQSNDLVDAMVAGVNAKASRVAPCLAWTGENEGKPAPTAEQMAEAKLVLIGAVKRWAEAGSGAAQSQTAGPFGFTLDTRQKSSGFNLWPSEITSLQDICKTDDDGSRSAFSVDTVSCGGSHSQICAIYFGASHCSCGADLAGTAIYELEA